jgi:hypothetical protein
VKSLFKFKAISGFSPIQFVRRRYICVAPVGAVGGIMMMKFAVILALFALYATPTHGKNHKKLTRTGKLTFE